MASAFLGGYQCARRPTGQAEVARAACSYTVAPLYHARFRASAHPILSQLRTEQSVLPELHLVGEWNYLCYTTYHKLYDIAYLQRDLSTRSQLGPNSQ